MRRILSVGLVMSLILLIAAVSALPALAQTPTPTPQPGLRFFTAYPSQAAQLGETVSLPLTLRVVGLPPQIVQLSATDLPKGWTATFRGGGRIIQSVYVDADTTASPELRLEPSQDVTAGTYHFVVDAKSEALDVKLPVDISVQEKLPPSLKFNVDLPTLNGTPSTTFRYSATLQNAGDQDTTVTLTAETPEGVTVTFMSAGQEVTSLPLKANQSASLDIQEKVPPQATAGQYPITVHAQGTDAQAQVQLTAVVAGQPELSLAGPDGRLSGDAYAGQQTPLNLTVQNTGSAPAQDVQLSTNAPTGWSVQFDPKSIPEIAPGQQANATANIQAPNNVVAGDYMITVNARSGDGSTKAADFRITVLTSTLWGVAGIGLIAVAVLVVGMAVIRFGRR